MLLSLWERFKIKWRPKEKFETLRPSINIGPTADLNERERNIQSLIDYAHRLANTPYVDPNPTGNYTETANYNETAVSGTYTQRPIVYDVSRPTHEIAITVDTVYEEASDVRRDSGEVHHSSSQAPGLEHTAGNDKQEVG